MVALYDWAYRGEPYAAVLRRRAGLYAGLAATWVVLAVLMAGGPRASSVGTGHGVSAMTYALNQCVVIPGYLKLAVWPDPLLLDYGFPRELSIGDALPGAALLAALLAATALLLRRHPALGFPAAWFFVTLAPTSSMVPIATEVAAERRMYLPLAGLIVLAVAGAYALAAATANRRLRVGAVLALAVLAAAPLAAATCRRNSTYRDPVAMWAASVRAVPDNPRARTNLGIALATRGRLDDAIDQFEASLRIAPDATRAGSNLANALAAQGKLPEAIARYRAVLAIEPDSPAAHHHLGLALATLGDRDGAIRHYREAVRLDPRDAEAHHDLGKALARGGRASEALDHLRRAAEIQPSWAAPAREAAWLLATWKSADVRDGVEAVTLGQRAAVLTGRGDARSLDTLAAAFAEAGRFADAAAAAGEALALAEAVGDGQLAGEIRARLALYRNRTPYRAAATE
jgi:tetratricopeptide (TPR) repeat protein